jgi:hypothetical protein
MQYVDDSHSGILIADLTIKYVFPVASENSLPQAQTVSRGAYRHRFCELCVTVSLDSQCRKGIERLRHYS